jgi:hypothetical protein
MAASTETAGPPGLKALKPKHKLIALMRASGRSNAAIASELGISAVSVGVALKSPLMRALVDQYLGEIESRTATSVADVLSTLRGETQKTLTTLLEIRDQGTREDSTRLAAAVELFDRQIPKVHRTDEARTVRIVLDSSRLDRLAEISAEGRALPAPAEAPEGATTASAPSERSCRCGEITWGEMNATLESVEGLEALWQRGADADG